VWLGFNMDLAKRKNNFSGEKGFSVLPRLFSRPQKGVWGMNASGLPFSKNLRTKKKNGN